MRKVLLIVMSLFGLLGISQKLVVTPNGLKDSLNLEKSYVVIDVPDKTAKQLHENAIKYITMRYKSPSDVIKGNIDGEYLKFDTYVPDFPLVKNGGVNIHMNTKYTTALSFKDGKIKYEVINIEIKNDKNMYTEFKGSIWSCMPIYNNDNELKRKYTKKELELYFNKNIQDIFEFMKNGDKEKNSEW